LAVRVAYYEDCLVERKSLTDGGWVCAPKAVFLMHGGREFQVRVDPSNLAPGRVYYAEVQGFVDVEHSSDPVFRLPITVIKPYLLTPQPLQSLLDTTPPNSTVETGQASELLTSGAASPSTRDGALLELNSENDTVALDDNGRTSKRAQARGVSLGCVTFRPGHRRRLFVQPPSGSTWADIIIQPIKLHSKVQCFIGLFARDFRVSLLVCALAWLEQGLVCSPCYTVDTALHNTNLSTMAPTRGREPYHRQVFCSVRLPNTRGTLIYYLGTSSRHHKYLRTHPSFPIESFMMAMVRRCGIDLCGTVLVNLGR